MTLCNCESIDCKVLSLGTSDIRISAGTARLADDFLAIERLSSWTSPIPEPQSHLVCIPH